MSNVKVKNNHSAPLSVAGVTIGAGKTVGIDSTVLKGATGSTTVQQWLKLEIIEIIEGGDDVPVVKKTKAKPKAKPKAEVPAAEVPAATVPAATVPAATVPAAEVPAAE